MSELDPCPRCDELITDDMGHECRTVRPGGWNAPAAKAEAIAFGEWLCRLESDYDNFEGFVAELYAEWKESQRD